MTLGNILHNKQILVCVGSGGVGKTTTAAALALQAACRGKRTLVLTIDPAKRLANSLGLKALGHEIQEVPAERLAATGRLEPGGALFAMMLDQEKAFNNMVRRHAKDPDAIKRILANPVYQQIAGSLAGSQEYAALTELHALDQAGSYDLIVVDTPPTAHALDFLDAPVKLTEAIDSPAIEWFRKLRGEKKSGWSVVGKTGGYVLKKLAKFVGSQFIDDIGVFFTEFNDILGGFRARAEEVFSLLREDRVGFVLVASPETMAVREALFFHSRLLESKMPLAGFVVNRIRPTKPSSATSESVVAELASRPEIGELGLSETAISTAAEALVRAHREQETLAIADRVAVKAIRDAAGTLAVAEVPQQTYDVHQIERLADLGAFLLPA